MNVPLPTYPSRFADEVVDDSEPEREQLRAQRRSAEQRLKKVGHQRKTIMQVRETPAAPIEISDSESSSERSTPSIPPPSSEVTSEHSGSNPTLDLGRFAYPAVPPVKRSQTIRTHEDQPSEKPTPYQRPLAKKKSPSNLQLVDVDRVSQCVCCHVSWTSRKTTVQKLNHIQSCAKKHCYDDETVRILVEKAVANSSPLKSKSNVKTALPIPTYLEDVVQDKAPKKRTKSKASGTLITGAEKNRSTILARANDILASTTPDESLHAHQSLPPSTQSFATSSLGGLQSLKSKGILFDDGEAPPPTQVFSGSRLGQRLPRSLFDLGDDDVLTPSSSTLRPSKCRSSSPPAFGPAGSHATVAPNFQEVAELPPDSESELDEPLVQVNVTKPKRRRPPKSDVSSGSSSVAGTPKKGRGRSVPKKTPKSKRVVFGEDWESFMTQRITEDDELLMRILRAEPLDFNLFWIIAIHYSPNASTSKLKTELRNFLDNQAILFYESTVWGARRKAKP